MGLNNVGAVGVAENLKRRRYAGVVGVNVGKNAATTGTAVIEDYLSCLTTLYPWGDFFTLKCVVAEYRGVAAVAAGRGR